MKKWWRKYTSLPSLGYLNILRSWILTKNPHFQVEITSLVLKTNPKPRHNQKLHLSGSTVMSKNFNGCQSPPAPSRLLDTYRLMTAGTIQCRCYHVSWDWLGIEDAALCEIKRCILGLSPRDYGMMNFVDDEGKNLIPTGSTGGIRDGAGEEVMDC